MDENKISISWDDLRTRKVEQRVSAMQAMRRNREYAQITDAAPEPPKRLKNLWYNAAIYMSLFGLLGGLAAWGCGTMLHFKNSARIEARNAKGEIEKVRSDVLLTPENRSMIVDQMAREFRNNPYFVIYVNEAMSDAQKKAAIERISTRDKNREFISNVLVFGISGMLIAMFLSFAEPLVSRNIPSAIINGSVGATLGIVGGVIVALFAEKLYAALGGVDGSVTSGRQIFARSIQWGVVGLFLTLGPGLVMRNGKKLLIGATGGLAGGAVGGALFDVIRNMTGSQDLSWLVGLGCIGLVAGLASALVESAAKSGWLKVTAGLIAGKQFILYRNPTFIGSSPDNQIYLFKDPSVGRRHAAIHIVNGGCELEDLPLGVATTVNGRPISRTRLRGGDQIQVGGTRFVFQEKQPSDLAPKRNGRKR